MVKRRYEEMISDTIECTNQLFLKHFKDIKNESTALIARKKSAKALGADANVMEEQLGFLEAFLEEKMNQVEVLFIKVIY